MITITYTTIDHSYRCSTLVFGKGKGKKSTYALNFQGAALFFEEYPNYVLNVSFIESAINSVAAIAQLKGVCVKTALVNLVGIKNVISQGGLVASALHNDEVDKVLRCSNVCYVLRFNHFMTD